MPMTECSRCGMRNDDWFFCKEEDCAQRRGAGNGCRSGEGGRMNALDMMKTSEMIEWQESRGGSMGPSRNLMIDKKYVGHFYEDASANVNVRQLLEDIEIRYNSFDVLVESLRVARESADEHLCAKIDAALKYASVK